MGLSALKCEVPSKQSKDSKVKLNQATRCQLRSFGQINDLFSSIDLQCTCTQTRIFAVQAFHGDHFNHNSQNSFSVHHNSRTPKMVDHVVTKISLPFPPPLPGGRLARRLSIFLTEPGPVAVYINSTFCFWSDNDDRGLGT